MELRTFAELKATPRVFATREFIRQGLNFIADPITCTNAAAANAAECVLGDLKSDIRTELGRFGVTYACPDYTYAPSYDEDCMGRPVPCIPQPGAGHAARRAADVADAAWKVFADLCKTFDTWTARKMVEPLIGGLVESAAREGWPAAFAAWAEEETVGLHMDEERCYDAAGCYVREADRTDN